MSSVEIRAGTLEPNDVKRETLFSYSHRILSVKCSETLSVKTPASFNYNVGLCYR